MFKMILYSTGQIMRSRFLINILITIACSAFAAEPSDSLSADAALNSTTKISVHASPPLSEQEARETVTKLYLSILYRNPDSSELDTYTRHLVVGDKDAAWVSEVLRNSQEGKILARYQQLRFILASFLIAISMVSILLLRLNRFRDLQNRPLIRWVSTLWLLLLLNGLLVSVLLEIVTPRPQVYSSLSYAVGFVTRNTGTDSWRPMTIAIEHLRNSPQIPLYSQLLFVDGVKFQYPPTALLVLDLGQHLTHASWPFVWKFLNTLSWLSVLAIGLCAGYLILESIRYTLPSKRYTGRWSESFLLMVLTLALTLFFYPLTRSYHLGQAQTGMTLAIALSLIAWHHHKQGIAGILLSLACVVKPQFGIVVVWAAIRKQWRFTTGFTASLAVFGIASLLLYGFRHMFDYLSALAFMGRHGESFYANQSVNGLVQRLLFNGKNLDFTTGYPPFNPIVYGLTLGSTVLLIGLALLWRKNQKPGTLDLACVLLTLTIASPIAWEHHYSLVLPILAAVSPIAIFHRSFGRYTSIYLISCLALTSHRMEWTTLFSESHLNVLQSHLLFGALMLLGCLYRTVYLETKNEHIQMQEANIVEQEHLKLQKGLHERSPF
jgi:alpha-1,2-mannosyltransferase